MNGKDGTGSHLVTIPPGPHLSDALISSPIVQVNYLINKVKRSDETEKNLNDANSSSSSPGRGWLRPERDAVGRRRLRVRRRSQRGPRARARPPRVHGGAARQAAGNAIGVLRVCNITGANFKLNDTSKAHKSNRTLQAEGGGGGEEVAATAESGGTPTPAAAPAAASEPNSDEALLQVTFDSVFGPISPMNLGYKFRKCHLSTFLTFFDQKMAWSEFWCKNWKRCGREEICSVNTERGK